ncbi:Lipopolysaccharide assembly protein B [Saezia sanguinis]|uniref:Lipopolysaccharide assembly protein B n=1 Tax=Saezia sanguinis TaxID=1965230 RepID=A0A433SFE8_9BURK|nr:tetratricopeptide repeat protein [Saezia sanguinis]RUS67458.1 Lipopolysaccharide assembly protein B [Saezia sanguinis]
MPIIFAFTIICQIICIIHVFKTGQERAWLIPIIFALLLGCAVYALMVIAPGMLGTRQGKRAVKKLSHTINAPRNLRTLRGELSLRDTAQSRVNLADELVELGQYDEAITHYQEALSGGDAHNPDTLLKLAQAQFQAKDYTGCLASLKDLLQNNPGYISQDGHLLQARALHELGELDQAAQTYQQLVEYYSGPDARYFYAKLLQQQNRPAEARQQLEEIQNYARIAPKFYKQMHRDCLAQANRLLKNLE